MDTWEYMTLTVEPKDAPEPFITISGPQYARAAHGDVTHVSGDKLLRFLDERGAEGWEVFNISPGGDMFWLKKRTVLDANGVPLPGQGLR